jgi:hypothetical protein
LVFNVAIPLLAPLALLPLAKLPHFFREEVASIRRAIEGGQLLWAAIPMSASACYLLASALDGPLEPPDHVDWHCDACVPDRLRSRAGTAGRDGSASAAVTSTRSTQLGLESFSLPEIVSAGAYFRIYAELVRPSGENIANHRGHQHAKAIISPGRQRTSAQGDDGVFKVSSSTRRGLPGASI